MKYEVKFKVDLGLSLQDNGSNYEEYLDIVNRINTIEGYIKQYDCYDIENTLSADFAEVKSNIENNQDFILPITSPILVSKVVEANGPYEAEDKVMDSVYCDTEWLDEKFFTEFLGLHSDNYRVRDCEVYEYDGDRLDSLTPADFMDYTKFEDIIAKLEEEQKKYNEIIDKAIKEADEEYEKKQNKKKKRSERKKKQTKEE